MGPSPTPSSQKFLGCFVDKKDPDRVFGSYTDDKDMTVAVSEP